MKCFVHATNVVVGETALQRWKLKKRLRYAVVYHHKTENDNEMTLFYHSVKVDNGLKYANRDRLQCRGVHLTCFLLDSLNLMRKGGGER